MYRLLTEIAQRAHETAKRRGQDVSAAGCMAAAAKEQAEYWKAIDEGRLLKDVHVIAEAQTMANSAFAAFKEYYEANLHNTDYDELADLVITAATWYYSAMESAGPGADPSRSIDVILASGILAFVIDRISGVTTMATMVNADKLRAVINLKLRFNEIR